MMKGKRALSLAMSIIALSMTACSEDYYYPDYTWVDGKIVAVGDSGYTFDEVFKDFEGTKNSAQSYFNVAKSVLAQAVTTTTDGILSIIDDKMEALHDTWKTNAKTNGTSYKEEQEKTFDSENVEDEDELRAKYIAEQKVSDNEDAFKTVKDGVTNTAEDYYLSEDLTKQYVSDNAPYHVSHILVKVDASSSGTGFYDGQISSDDAKQIGNVVRMLSNGTSFGSVAQIASDDGSASQYGELYTSGSMIAMQKDTSYVNEFKLGVYGYDAFLNPALKDSSVEANTSNKSIREQLRIPGTNAEKGDITTSTVSSEFQSTPLAQGMAFGIPLSVAFTMSYVSELTTNPENGRAVTTDNKKTVTATQYPRNIYFNNYFNYRGVSFIYDDRADYDASFLAEAQSIALLKGIGGVNTIDDVAEKMSWKYDEYVYVKNMLSNVNDSRFVNNGTNLVGYEYDPISGESVFSQIKNKSVLVDERGNQIIVARAGTSGDSGYQGIHFIIVNSDPFVDYANKYTYYRVNVPKASVTDNSPDTSDYNENPSFINFVKADANSNTTYNDRKSSVEKVIENAIDNISFTLYEENKAAFKTKYNKDFSEVLGTEINDQIEKYIKVTEDAAEEDSNDSLDSSWEAYVRELNLQYEFASKRMVPTVGVAAFEAGNIPSSMEDLCHVE